MNNTTSRSRISLAAAASLRVALAALVATAFCAMPVRPAAAAGNEANSVLYSHHTEPAGELEINVFEDFSRGIKEGPYAGLPSYRAQLIELEYAITDRLVASFYLETERTNGIDGDKLGGYKFEARYRLFEYGAFLNPVLYAEYENNAPGHRFITEVLGRLDRPEPPGPPRTEHALETKLILGQDLGRDFDLAFNWINEANLDDGHWEFGYAAGLNYTVWRAPKHAADVARPAGSGGFDLKQIKIGAEMYGGLGDTTLGLTASSKVTQQFAGINLLAKFDNGMQAKVGGAFGLNGQSDAAVVRLMLGWEMK